MTVKKLELMILMPYILSLLVCMKMRTYVSVEIYSELNILILLFIVSICIVIILPMDKNTIFVILYLLGFMFFIFISLVYSMSILAERTVFLEFESLGIRFLKVKWTRLELASILCNYIKIKGDRMLSFTILFGILENVTSPESAIFKYESFLVLQKTPPFGMRAGVELFLYILVMTSLAVGLFAIVKKFEEIDRFMISNSFLEVDISNLRTEVVTLKEQTNVLYKTLDIISDLFARHIDHLSYGARALPTTLYLMGRCKRYFDGSTIVENQLGGKQIPPEELSEYRAEFFKRLFDS